MYLMGTWMLAFSLLEWQSWVVMLVVALGLSAVIFVHELGHFLVAKMCGVKCEKFYIGFDVNGWKLFKFQKGETEYGIGALPLGGYVKMLGQEDNPARVAEEMERAKLAGEGGEEAFTLDPRSYLAQSVPERMAIISAGVIMNVIFAVVFASVAYAMGVEYAPCVIGGVLPGEAAWQAGIRPGDTILSIGGSPVVGFSDLQKNVALGDIANGVQMEIRRPGVDAPLAVTVRPVRKADGLAPRIGAFQMATNQLFEQQAVYVGTPAAAAEPPFAPGDTIVAVGEESTSTYAELQAALVRNAGKALEFKVERRENKSAASETHSIRVDPLPVRWIGAEAEIGEVVAVQPDSPAATAGIKTGDRILELGGQAVGNSLTLPDRLRALAGQTVTLKVQRKGQENPVDLQIEPREAPWIEASATEGSPMSAPAIGIAYAIGAKLVTVEPGSPADQAGLKPGDMVATARLIQPQDLDLSKAWVGKRDVSLDFADGKLNWPRMFFLTQQSAPGSKLELVLADGRKLELEPTPVADWYYPERGFAYQALTDVRRADSFGEALKLGVNETVDSLMLVVRFLRKIGTQVSPMSAGGPGTIFVYAAASAEAGLSQFLIFLCVLSANLAVINFLPIPVLDGGHMVFLAYEGITGKPLNEKWFMRLTYAGFLFILMLMLFVIGLDVNRLVEWIQSLLQ